MHVHNIYSRTNILPLLFDMSRRRYSPFYSIHTRAYIPIAKALNRPHINPASVVHIRVRVRVLHMTLTHTHITQHTHTTEPFDKPSVHPSPSSLQADETQHRVCVPRRIERNDGCTRSQHSYTRCQSVASVCSRVHTNIRPNESLSLQLYTSCLLAACACVASSFSSCGTLHACMHTALASRRSAIMVAGQLAPCTLRDLHYCPNAHTPNLYRFLSLTLCDSLSLR